MTPTARPLGDEWGIDCSQKLTAASAKALRSLGRYDFVWRYVFFNQPRPGDLDPAETAAILDAGLTLLVVQHVRNPGWTASDQLGGSDGQWAVRNAAEAGYPPNMGLSVALDLEGLANSGAPVAEFVDQWCLTVASAGYEPVLYVGYDAGLSPQELYDLPHVARYWSDAGPRSVVTRGFCCKQGPEQTIAGVRVDTDHATPDMLGGVLVGLCVAPDTGATS
jgi:hypothetical protein